MQPRERMAWYNLAVILLALTAYATMLILTRHPAGSQAAFGLFGLLGFSGKFAGNRREKVAGDERDRAIASRAVMASFIVFWVYFTLYCVMAMKPWAYTETIPTYLLSTLLWTGLCVWLGVHAITTILCYRSDATEEATLLDRLKRMNHFRVSGFVGIVVILLVYSPFWFTINGVDRGEVSQVAGYSFCLALLILYIAMRWSTGRSDGEFADKATVARVRKNGDRTLGIALLGAAFSTGLLWFLPLEIEIARKIPMALFLVLLAGNLGLQLGMIVYGGRSVENNDTAAREETHA